MYRPCSCGASGAVLYFECKKATPRMALATAIRLSGLFGKSAMPSYCRAMSTVVSGLFGSEFVGAAPLKVIPRIERPANLERMPPLGRFGFASITKLMASAKVDASLIRLAFSMLAIELLWE